MATTIAPETLTEKIEIAKQIVSAPSDLGEDFELTYGSSFNWEHLFSPATSGINILGDLMVVAACMSDFSLNQFKPIKLINNPISFKACLIQISNSGYQAFMLAHNNMEKISLITQLIPSTMENVKKILESKNEKLIDKILPIQLMKIAEAAEQCATRSNEVVDIFDQVNNLMGEVLTAVTVIKGLKEKQLDDTKKEREVLEGVVANFPDMSEKSKKNNELLEKKVEEAQNDVNETMRNMPSKWKLAGMNFLEGIAVCLPGFLINFLLKRNVVSDYMPLVRLLLSALVPGKVNLDEEGLRKNLMNVLMIIDIATKLDKFAAMDFKNTDSSKKSEFSVAKYISMLETIAKEALGCEMVEKICQAGIDAMKTLEGLLSSGSFDDTKEVRGKIQDFSKQAAKLQQTVNSMSNPDSGIKPSMSNDLQSSGRVSEFEVAMAKLKAKILQKNLKIALKNAENSRDRIVENNQKYIETQNQLQSKKFSEMSYGEAIKLLHDGLDNMNQLKGKWGAIDMFFRSVSNIVQESMNKNLLDFRKHVDETSTDLDLLNCQQNLEILRNSAINATEASSFIHGMADMFTKVSAKYIMPNMAKLNQLIAFDADTDGMSIEQKREELKQSFTRDSNEIHKLIVAEKNALIIRIKDRMKIARDQYASLLKNSGNLEPEN